MKPVHPEDLDLENTYAFLPEEAREEYFSEFEERLEQEDVFPELERRKDQIGRESVETYYCGTDHNGRIDRIWNKAEDEAEREGKILKDSFLDKLWQPGTGREELKDMVRENLSEESWEEIVNENVRFPQFSDFKNYGEGGIYLSQGREGRSRKYPHEFSMANNYGRWRNARIDFNTNDPYFTPLWALEKMKKINNLGYGKDIDMVRGKSKTKIRDPKFPIQLDSKIMGILSGNSSYNNEGSMIWFCPPSLEYHQNVFDLLEEDVGKIDPRPGLEERESNFESLGRPEQEGTTLQTTIPKIVSDIALQCFEIEDPEIINARSKRLPPYLVENPDSQETWEALQVLDDFRTSFDPKRSEVQIYSPNPIFVEDLSSILDDLGYDYGVKEHPWREGKARGINLSGENGRRYMEEIGNSELME